MKEIKAYVRPSKIEAVVEGLRAAGARDLTLIRVDAIGPMADPAAEKHHLVRAYRERYSAVAKLEIVCTADEAPRFCEVIRSQAHTGDPGDGRIFVTAVERGINIRTGTEGTKAL